MTNPKDNIDLLILYKVGLQCGVLDTKALVDFADRILAKEDNPDYLFIEISLCGNDKSRLIDVLSDFTREYRKKISGEYLFGAIRSNYIKQEIDLEGTVILLYKLKDELDLTEKEEAFIYNIDDQYYLASDNVIGTVKEVENGLLNFLAKYKESDLGSHIPWKK
ncbi:MAG: hypothetical protein AAF632_26240 [Bacteroidota bacterium]